VQETTPRPGGGLRSYFRSPLSIEAVWLSAPAFVLVVAVLLSPIRPFDYFWSLVQGRAIVQLGRIPTENLFLHTMPAGASFFDQPWLGQLAMFATFRLGGHTANLLLFATLLAFATVVAMDTGLRLGAQPRMVAVVALAVSPLLALGAGVRTQMFAYPCFALILRGAVLRGEGRGLVRLLPYAVVATLWSNLHGSFVLAPAIFALAGVGASIQRRPPGQGRRLNESFRDVLVIGLATLVNPRGPMIYAYVAGLGNAVRGASPVGVDEWLALSLRELAGVAFHALAVGGLIWATIRHRRIVPPVFLPHLVFVILALLTQRFLPWWALSAVVALPCVLAAPGTAERQTGPGWPNLALLGLFGVLVLACLPGAPIFDRAAVRSHLPYPGARALGFETPLQSAEALARGYKGKLFHSQAVGGLVEWTVAADKPKPVAFVDQRFELTPPSLWQDYFAICEARADWKALLARYEIGTLLLDEKSAPRLLAELERDAEWRLVMREYSYAVYERTDTESR
jgi:hypothetical protein